MPVTGSADVVDSIGYVIVKGWEVGRVLEIEVDCIVDIECHVYEGVVVVDGRQGAVQVVLDFEEDVPSCALDGHVYDFTDVVSVTTHECS